MTRRRPGFFARVRCVFSPSPVLLIVVLGAGGCELPPAGDSLTSHHGPILGGTADTTTEAVMALIQQAGTPSMPSSSACTGTTIARVGAFGILLTAAHCVVANDKGRVIMPLKMATPNQLYVLPGADWEKSAAASAYFGVDAVATYPGYDGAVDSPIDVALVRYLGATASTPIIPALTPAEDTLAANSTITLIGYGKTETDAMNSVRRRVDRRVATISSRQFSYDQTDIKGACEGDSGGPALVQTPGGARVAGVTSFGDATCRRAGISVRVSSAAAFIQSFIAAAPPALSCEECSIAAVAPSNACFTQGAACSNGASPCGAFLNCLETCQTTACANQCANTLSTGATQYAALVKCQCGGDCAAACAQDQTCASVGPPAPPTACGGFSDPRPACQSCVTSRCCAQATACGNDPSCAACMRAFSSECRINQLYNALSTCQAACQGAPCSASTTPPADAGAAPGAPADAGISPPADAATTNPGATGDMDGGCGCAAAPPPGAAGLRHASAWGAAAGMLALLFFRRRRK